MFYVIHGGRELNGELPVSGAKNVALKLIIAALLLKGKTTLHNVPRIRDVLSLIEIINALGGVAKFIGNNSVEIENTLTKYEIPIEYAARIRVSFMLMVPLLHTFGKALVPNPGGCRLGARPVDRFVEGITTMGAEVTYNSDDGYYHASLPKTHEGTYTFSKPSHTGTEFLIMHAARTEGGTSIIHNAAREPEIDELIAMLNQAGAHIKRSGDTIEIQGKKNLEKVTVTVGSDRNEAVSFLILAALSSGTITVSNLDRAPLSVFLEYFEKAGCHVTFDETGRKATIVKNGSIKPVSIVTAPHPGFMTDWQPLWAILMTQADGVSVIHETVYENRFGYVSELQKHGADISYTNPIVKEPQSLYQFTIPPGVTPRNQAIQISGKTPLHNAVTHMSDLRAGACLVIASLLAEGKSVIDGAEQVERGYENIGSKLTSLGAKVYAIEE